MADDNTPTCSICLSAFSTEDKKPWDLGCGHSFCEACLRAHPRSFRNCPECRTRAGVPHVNIALLRHLRPSQAPGSSGAGTAVAQRPTQQQPQQPVPELIGAGSHGPTGGANPVAAAAALAGSVQQALRQRGPGPLLQHNAEVVAWKANIWLWLGPLLALLYIISPLDIIPDFLPLIGWLDDFLVALYLIGALLQRAAPRS